MSVLINQWHKRHYRKDLSFKDKDLGLEDKDKDL